MNEKNKDRSSDFPVLQPSQYALLHAEVHTGYVLMLDGERYTGFGEKYMVFESLDDLEQYANNKTKVRPEVECAAYDYQQNLIKIIRSNEIHQESRASSNKKAWWKFW